MHIQKFRLQRNRALNRGAPVFLSDSSLVDSLRWIHEAFFTQQNVYPTPDKTSDENTTKFCINDVSFSAVYI
jgi:hypothetical protein